MTEWAQAFFFIIVLSLPGAAAYPLLRGARAWGLAKWLGLLAFSWLVWLSASTKLLPFNAAAARGLYAAFLAVAVLNVSIRPSCRAFWRRTWRSVLFQEAVALGLFTLFLLFRGVLPDFHYTDRLHDYGFIMSAYRSSTLPPPDPFLAVESLNYYYYGHYLVALAAKLTGVRVELAFTFIMGYFFAAAALAAYALSKRIYLRLGAASEARSSLSATFAGMLGAFLVLFAGNVQPFLAGKSVLDHYWYPAATLMVPRTRMDFPFYSFVNNELHAHSLNLVNSIVVMALILRVAETARRPLRHNPLPLALLSLALGAGYLTHAWDFAAQGILLGLAVLFATHNALRTLVLGSAAGLGALALYLPFWIGFIPFGRGVALVPSIERSSLVALAVHWGPFLLVLGSWLARLRASKQTPPSYALALATLGILLILIPELIYVVDIHGNEPRFNTMWRCAFQAWIALACLTGPLLIWLRRPVLALVPIAMAAYPLLTLHTIIKEEGPRLRSLAVTGKLRQEYWRDMSAIDWLAARTSAEEGVVAEACGENYTDYSRVSAVSGLPTILGWSNIEAQIRKAAWHEPIRPMTAVEKAAGGADSLGRRTQDMRSLYEAGDPRRVREIVARYRIRYIFVGTLERLRYTELNERPLKELYGVPAFELGMTRVYATRRL